MTKADYERLKAMFAKERIRYPVSLEEAYNRGIQKCLDLLDGYYGQQDEGETGSAVQDMDVKENIL